MKTIVNKTQRPLKILLGGRRALRLGPGKEGQISTKDSNRDSLLKLVASGDVAVYDDGGRSASVAGGKSSSGAGGPGAHHTRVSGGRGGDR